MPIYEFTKSQIRRLSATSFGASGFHERDDLQRLLREQIEVIAPDTLVISEEFDDWDGARRRADLLGLDRGARLVVIELKRNEEGGHMELQAIRYAAMVSTMTFDQAVSTYEAHLAKTGKSDVDARETILSFLGWDEPDEESFAQDVRLILVAAHFKKELAASVLWLIDHGIEIDCVRLKPYKMDDRLLVDVQKIIPLPDAEEYQFQRREKALKERSARASNQDFTKFRVEIGGESHEAMAKRNAIHLICERLCAAGTNPDEIADLLNWKTIWYVVEGDVGPAEFVKLATEKAEKGGPLFDPRRWFVDEGDALVHANGCTYAFTSQWGGERWHRAMNELREKYPSFNIMYAPMTGPGASVE